MCGLYGWSFNNHEGTGTAQREALATVLSINNSLRGGDSYGARIAWDGGKIEIVREVGDIMRAPGIAAWGHSNLVMAHTRQATHGEVTPENCHPFRRGNVTLAHNGVISNHGELNSKHGRRCVVDSDHIALHMAEGKPLSDIQGYGTIAWVDESNPTTVKLCRMRSGSLSIYGITLGTGKHAQQVGTVWSSDEKHLRAAIKAAGLDSFPYENPAEGHVYEVKGGKLWTTAERHNLTAPVYMNPRAFALSQGRAWTEAVSDERFAAEDEDTAYTVSTIVHDSGPASWADRRNRLARELGLIPLTSSSWVDDKGERVTSDELDDLMESAASMLN